MEEKRRISVALALAVVTGLLGCERATAEQRRQAVSDISVTTRAVELQPLTDPRLIREVAPRAQRILEQNRDQPIGTEVPFEHEGRRYVGRIEMHEHPYGGPEKPWGPHRGVTVYALVP